MNDKQFDLLRARLKQEADATTPAFSGDLHGRIMRRVRETRAADSAGPSPVRWWIPFGIAAALFLVAWMFVPTEPSSQPKPPVAVHFDTVNHLIAQGGHPIQWVLDQPIPSSSMAYLDQDAKSFGKFIVQQFDFVPTSPRNSTN